MWPRETKARSGDIEARFGRERPSHCLWVLQRSTAKRAGAKKPKVYGGPRA
jgi:hypothetical protein